MTTTTTTTVTYTWTAQGATWQCQGRPCVVCGDELATSEPTTSAPTTSWLAPHHPHRAITLPWPPLDQRDHDGVCCLSCKED